jgi:hypothetical protein
MPRDGLETIANFPRKTQILEKSDAKSDAVESVPHPGGGGDTETGPRLFPAAQQLPAARQLPTIERPPLSGQVKVEVEALAALIEALPEALREELLRRLSAQP